VCIVNTDAVPESQHSVMETFLDSNVAMTKRSLAQESALAGTQ